MAEDPELALLRSALGATSLEKTSLENLFWARLLTAGAAINSSGVISTTVAMAITVDPANLSAAVPVAKGGTALTSGTSGGVLGFTASGVIASSVALTASAIVLGGGAGATPTPMASLGTTTTVLHGNAAGAPTFGAVVEADITLAANTTNDVSITKHGFAPIAPNDATKFLDGTGVFSVPAAGLDYCQAQSFVT